jgi:hypothetical protein
MGWLDKILGREKSGAETGGMGQRPQEQPPGGQAPSTPSQEPREPETPAEGEPDRM